MKKKKYKPLLIICLVLVPILLIISYRYYSINIKKFKEVDELNNHSSLPYALRTPLSDCDVKGLKEEGDEYGVNYTDDKNIYYFSGFPDLGCDLVFTGCYTSRNDIDVLGIKIGTSIADAKSILSRYKYRKISTSDESYKKGRIRISLYTNGSSTSISRINIRLDTTDYYSNGSYK